MSLQQYNQLMSSMLNQNKALAKLRAELEGGEGRKYWRYKKFGHLVHNCRNKEGEEKGKVVPQNKFEVLASRVVQCRVRGEVKVKQQKTEVVRCFRCWEEGHFKWECPKLKEEKQKRREEEVAHVIRPQNVQQERRLVHPL